MNAPSRGFKLNTNNARQVGASGQITAKGAYLGTFVRAEYVVSKKGTHGIEFDFKTHEGQSAKYMSIWTENASGEELGGRKVVDALMTCMGLRGIELSKGPVPKYDVATKQDVVVQAEIFRDLMNKPVGMVLHREEYLSNDGQSKWKNAIYCPFEADTGRIAAERLDNKPALGLEKILARLEDRPLKAGAASQRRPATTGAGPGLDQGGGFDDMDDDIPFITGSMHLDMEPSKVRRLNRASF